MAVLFCFVLFVFLPPHWPLGPGMVQGFIGSFLGGILARNPSLVFAAAGMCFGVYLEQSYVLPRLNDEIDALIKKEEEMRKKRK